MLCLATFLVSGCVTDGHELSENQDALTAENKLAVNKLAVNKLAVNKLAVNKLAVNSLETRELMGTAAGREVMSYVVGCALRSGTSATLQDSAGTLYTYPGWIGLAPAWATRAPTVSERRWVTACMLARTNVHGTAVSISMRHDTNLALLSSAAERDAFPLAEGAFYGDLFGPGQPTYACSNRAWTAYADGTFRACALSSNGSTTDCGFVYTGSCNATATCTDTTASFGSCRGAGVTYAEVITIFLSPSQVQ